MGVGEKFLISAILKYFYGDREKTAKTLRIGEDETLRNKIRYFKIDVDKLKKGRIIQSFVRNRNNIGFIFSDLDPRYNSDVISDIIKYDLRKQKAILEKKIKDALQSTYCNYGRTSKNLGISHKYLAKVMSALYITEEEEDKLKKAQLAKLVSKHDGDLGRIFKEFKSYGSNLRTLLCDLETLNMQDQIKRIYEYVFQVLTRNYGKMGDTIADIDIPAITFYRNKEIINLTSHTIEAARRERLYQILRHNRFSFSDAAFRLGITEKKLSADFDGFHYSFLEKLKMKYPRKVLDMLARMKQSNIDIRPNYH